MVIKKTIAKRKREGKVNTSLQKINKAQKKTAIGK